MNLGNMGENESVLGLLAFRSDRGSGKMLVLVGVTHEDTRWQMRLVEALCLEEQW